ncbi:MAG: TonB-dependent receptor domain-containing protein [Fidelibacterota bacterium]
MSKLVRRYGLLCLLVLPLGLVMAVTTGKIAGHVVDEGTGEPLAGINILIVGTSHGAATDANGDYVILFIPPGIYEVEASSIAHYDVTKQNITVYADLTTTIDFEMVPQTLEGKSVTVTAEKPLIQHDLTSSRSTLTGEGLENIPMEDVTDILNLTPGFVDGHARGGRNGEVLYLINGVPAIDPMSNTFDSDVPEYALAEADIITSGFSAEYSNALSGVVNMVTQEGSSKFSGRFRIKTDNEGFLDAIRDNTHQKTNLEFSVGGPLPKLPIGWFFSGEFQNTQGRYGISEERDITLNGSITWRPFSKTKIKLDFNHHESTWNSYSHRYSRTTYENEDSDGDGRLDRIVSLTSFELLDSSYYEPGGYFYPEVSSSGFSMAEVLANAGLSVIQGTDTNGDNFQTVNKKRMVLVEVDVDGVGNLLPGDGDFRNEDLNGNGIWDITDLNRSGSTSDSSFIDLNGDGAYQWGYDTPIPNTAMADTTINGTTYDIIAGNRNLTNGPAVTGFNDSFSMLDHLLRNDKVSTLFSINLNHQLGEKTYFQIMLSRFRTYYHYDTDESSSIAAYIDYLEEHGITDIPNKYQNDLFTDWNNNDFIDISEDAFPDDPSKWLTWETIPIQNTQDTDKFYTYGSGTTFYRLRWNEDDKIYWNFKTVLTSQVTKYHMLKGGFEVQVFDVFDHDVDMPSGGNIYGQNIGSMSHLGGRYGEDFSDTGFEGCSSCSGNGTWDHWDYGSDGVAAIDGNGDGDYDDDFVDLPPDAGEGDGKVNYGELAESWDELYADETWNEEQGKLDPIWMGFFLEDKMEFEALIVNAGVRIDYFDPRFDNYPSNLTDPVVDQSTGGQVKDPTSVQTKFYSSPRIGIAFPVSDRDVMYFNYGRAFQLPQFRYMYRNINWDFSGAFPIVGNPDLLPETTTYYELGIRHQMGIDWRLEVKGFFKDIQGLTDTQQTWIKANQYYTRHVNGDYGSTRGLEIDLFKRFSRRFGGNINYTYSVARGKSSSALQNYRFTWASRIIPRDENFLDWDQRHTVNANLQMLMPIPFVGDVELNTTMQYGSGLPYSPPVRSLEPEINTRRLPPTFVMNLYAQKEFRVGQNLHLSAFMWVDNLFSSLIKDLFGIKNISDIADEEWFDLYREITKRYEDKDTRFFGSEGDNNGIDDDGDGYVDETLKDEYMMLMDTDGDGTVDWNKDNPAGGTFGIPGNYREGALVNIGVSLKF